MTQIDTIVFDYGGVVADQYSEPYQTQMTHMLGISLAEMRRLLDESSQLGRAYRLGELSKQEFWTEIRKHRSNSSKEFDADAIQELWAKTYIPNGAMLSMLRYLMNVLKIQIGVASNDDQSRWEYATGTCDISSFCSISIASYQLGVLKPDPAFFEAMLAKCRRRHRPEMVLYVDDRETHVEGAQTLRMHGHQFLNAGEFSLFISGLDLRKFVP